MSEVSLHDLAEEVLSVSPNGNKTEWGEALIRLVGDQGDAIAAEAHSKYVAAMGAFVSSVKAAQARAEQAARIAHITYHGRPLTPTVSVRGEYGRQLKLWLDASPREFVEAVFREQSVVLGRLNSNKLRIKIAELCQQDDALMELPTLADVCNELDIDPAQLELEELAS